MNIDLKKILNFEALDMNAIKKKGKKIGIIAGTIAVGLIGILILWFIFFGSQQTYKELERTMKQAANEYIKANPEELPARNESKEIAVSTLIASNNMKEMAKYVKKEVICDGKVIVTNHNEIAVYIPYLDCGKNYKTQTMRQELLDNIETNSLYELEDDPRYSHFFKGESVNNFVEFAGNLWRILGITNEGNIRLLQDGIIKDKIIWDDRYNPEAKQNWGINQYQRDNGLPSRIKEYFDEMIYYEDIFNVFDFGHMVERSACIINNTIVDSNKNEIEGCEKYVYQNQSILSWEARDYHMGSLDDKCSSENLDSCTNYNYLTNYSGTFWTLYPNPHNTYEVKYIVNGYEYYRRASADMNFKIVIELNGNLLYDSGDGTRDYPYYMRD